MSLPTLAEDILHIKHSSNCTERQGSRLNGKGDDKELK